MTLKYVAPVIIILLTIFPGCKYHNYIAPHFKEYHKDPYGSYIVVSVPKSGRNVRKIKGELISIENDSIYILGSTSKSDKSNAKNNLTSVPVKDVKSYILYFARVNTGDMYMLSWLLILGHGWFSLTSIIINTICANAIEAGEAKFYTKKGTNSDIEDLLKFSRFPQGMPDYIREASLYQRARDKK